MKRIAIYIEGKTRESRIALLKEILAHSGEPKKFLDGRVSTLTLDELAAKVEDGSIAFVFEADEPEKKEEKRCTR